MARFQILYQSRCVWDLSGQLSGAGLDKNPAFYLVDSWFEQTRKNKSSSMSLFEFG